VRATLNIPNHAELIKCVLDGLINAGALEIASGAAPPGPPEDAPLIEDPEELWQLPHQTARQGGDCEDYVIWRCATLRATGEDPDATAEILQVGRRDLHCVVRRGDGQLEDVWGQLQDGTWRMGFGFGDLNPISALKSVASNVAGGIKAIASPVGSLIGMGQPPPPKLPAAAGAAGQPSWISSLGNTVRNVAATVAAQGQLMSPGYPYPPGTYPPAPYPGTTTYPPGYPYPTSYGGIPTAPTSYGYPSAGYPSAGYPSDPYSGIPWYPGEVDDYDDDEDDDDDIDDDLKDLVRTLKQQQQQPQQRQSGGGGSGGDDQHDQG
jgi:hypothetical protein